MTGKDLGMTLHLPRPTDDLCAAYRAGDFWQVIEIFRVDITHVFIPPELGNPIMFSWLAQRAPKLCTTLAMPVMHRPNPIDRQSALLPRGFPHATPDTPLTRVP